MKTSAIFDEIVATCTLVSLRGVIPSLLEYQYQLKQRIELFCGELKQKQHSDEVLDALCRLICLVVDLNSRQNLEAQGVSWHGYELEQVFYGFSNAPLFTEQHASVLFAGKNVELIGYARSLFALSPIPLTGSPPRQSQLLIQMNAFTPPLPEEAQSGSVVEMPVSPRPLCRSVLLKALPGVLLLLAALWSGCWYYLKGEL